MQQNKIIIPVSQNDRGDFVIKISPDNLPSFQKALIEGFKEQNSLVFFELERAKVSPFINVGGLLIRKGRVEVKIKIL